MGRQRNWRLLGRVLVLRSISMGIVLCLGLLGRPAWGQVIQIEAESYSQPGGGSGNLGGEGIGVVSCSAALGGLAVEGFDNLGDWIKISFHLSGPLCFSDSLRTAGPVDEPHHAVGLRFYNSSDLLVATDTVVTAVGKGIG